MPVCSKCKQPNPIIPGRKDCYECRNKYHRELYKKRKVKRNARRRILYMNKSTQKLIAWGLNKSRDFMANYGHSKGDADSVYAHRNAQVRDIYTPINASQTKKRAQ